MRWRPGSISEIAQRIGIPAGTGSAGLFGGLALTHNTAAAVGVALVLAAAASLPEVFESIYKRRPAILKAKGDAKADCIKAAAEAAALAKRTEIQSEIVRSGLEPGKTEPAIELLRQLAMNPTCPQTADLTTRPSPSS